MPGNEANYKLGFDPSGFIAGTKKAEQGMQAFAKGMERSLDASLTRFKAVSTGLGQLAGAIRNVAKGMAEATNRSAAEMRALRMEMAGARQEASKTNSALASMVGALRQVEKNSRNFGKQIAAGMAQMGRAVKQSANQMKALRNDLALSRQQADATNATLARMVAVLEEIELNSRGAGAEMDKASTKGERGASRVSSALSTVRQRFSDVARAASRAGQTMRAGLRNVTRVAAGLGIAAGAISVKMASLASDANEAASKFQFVFQQAADKTGQSLDDFSKRAGRSRYEMRSMAADIGALVQPMGFTREKTGELSTAVAKLAVDLSSFFNVSESDALIALKAGIVGESEPLRRLGVNLNEAKIQQEAFRLGIAKTKDEVNGAIKTQAILSLVFKETAQAQGDAIRTGDQFANSWRRMKSFIKDTATDLGQTFIPVATKYARSVGDAAKRVAEWTKANRQFIQQKFDQYLGKVESFVGGIWKAMTNLYQTSGPLLDVLGGIYDKAVGLYQSFMQWFSTLPKGTQDALKVGAALAVIGTALSQFGGSIPVIGQFATAIGDLINPLKLAGGALGALMPLIGAGGGIAAALASLGPLLISFVAATGPVGLLIAAIIGAGGLVFALSSEDGLTGVLGKVGDMLKGSFAEAFEAAKDAAAGFVAYINGDMNTAVGSMHKALGDLANAVGLSGLGAELKAKGEAEVSEAKLAPQLREKRVKKYGNTGARHLEIKSDAERNLVKESQRLRELEAMSPEARAVLASGMGFDPVARQREVVEQAAATKRMATERANAFINDPERVARSLAGTGLGKDLKQAGGAFAGRIGDAADLAGAFTAKLRSGFVDAAKTAMEKLEQGRAYNQARGAAQLAEEEQRRPKTAADKQLEAIKSMASSLGLGLSPAQKQNASDVAKIQEQAKLDYQRNNPSSVAQTASSVQQAQQAQNPDAYNVDVTGGVIPGSQFVKAPKPKKQRKLTAAQAAAAQKKAAKAAEEGAANLSAEGTDQRISRFLPTEGREPIYEFSSDNPQGKVVNISQRQANKNLSQNIRENKAADAQMLKGLRSSTAGQAGGQQDYLAVAMLLKKAQELEIAGLQEQDAERRKMLLTESDQRRQAAQAMVSASEKSVTGLKDLTDAATKAGVDMKKLDEAEQARLLHAQGKQTPQEQAMQQQAQNFQQQVSNWMQQQAQQGMQAMQQQAQAQFQGMVEGGQQMLQQALGGPAQVQALIDEASAKGDMKSAAALIRQRLEEQLKVSLSNLHNLASDPLAGGGLGAAHGGVSNDAYFMSLDIPLVRLIKFLQAQLAHLPKMAAGGIATKPTQALIGEAGPEAIVPLTSFANMLGSLPVFGKIQSAVERMGDWFNGAGNPGMAQQYFANLTRVQNTYDYVMDSLWNSRRINLSSAAVRHAPAAIGGGGATGSAGMVGGMVVHGGQTFNLHLPNITHHSQADALLDAVESAARRRGSPAFASGNRGVGFAR